MINGRTLERHQEIHLDFEILRDVSCPERDNSHQMNILYLMSKSFKALIVSF